jgi:activator of Hsp90 ATPase-like protein
MERKHDIEVRKTKIIEGSLKVVFSALTEPEKLAEWFQDDANLDVRVGSDWLLLKKNILSGIWIGITIWKGLSWKLFLINDYHIVGNLKIHQIFLQL